MPVPFPTNDPIRRWPLGLIFNRSHLCSTGSVFTGTEGAVPYTLAIVEFDDQGLCFGAREQMSALQAELDGLKGQNPIIIVFTHGWKHDSRLDDDNLTSFRAVLAQTATASAASAKRPVLGIFVAWRGLSWYGLGIENLTFYDRKEAALRVALGSVRELLGRLRVYRQSNDKSVLVVVGHSFGGLIVYSAVAQSLIEAAATQAGVIVPSFANLVLLVNPAFEAARYLPIHDQIRTRTDAGSFAPQQHPVFVSVTATNDWATGLAFPAGMLIATRGESVRRGCERQALIHTMGHLHWMMTHRLTAPHVTVRARSQPRVTPHLDLSELDAELVESKRFAASAAPRKQHSFVGGAQLEHVPPLHPLNPFWVVQASREVVDGHNGIWGQVFVKFVRSLVINAMTALS